MKASNVKAMREALGQIHELLSIGGNPDTAMCIRYEAAYQIAAEALSAPPRNCDVGTAEAQTERFMKFCEAHKPDEHQFTENGELLCPSTGCELIACNYGQCALAWAQMPYEE